jgi:DNA-binding CsgD family transcriptional regulator
MSAVLHPLPQPQKVRRDRAPPDRLTERETEVLHMLGRGLSNKQIAGELELSQRTVEIHRQRIMEKVDAHTAVHFGVRYARMHPARCGIDVVTGTADAKEALQLAKRARELIEQGSHSLAIGLLSCIEGLMAKHVPIVDESGSEQ